MSRGIDPKRIIILNGRRLSERRQLLCSSLSAAVFSRRQLDTIRYV